MPKTGLLTRTRYKRVIHELLSSGNLTIEHTARKVGIPLRTLQRRLHDNGLTYSELVDEVRRESACRLLKADRMSVAEIAVALGFSDPSNFSRAFHRWLGVSPSKYRNKHSARTAKKRHKGLT